MDGSGCHVLAWWKHCRLGEMIEGLAETRLQVKLDFWHLVGLAAAVSGGGGGCTEERTMAVARGGRGTTPREGELVTVC